MQWKISHSTEKLLPCHKPEENYLFPQNDLNFDKSVFSLMYSM